jgi:heat shock protein HtpX
LIDFAQRQAHNQRCSAALVGLFIVVFLVIGSAVDYLYLDGVTPGRMPFPIATVMALTLATFTTLAAYYGGSGLILGSLGAEKLDIQIPEHRELRNIVAEMALASGSTMPQVFVIYDPAPNALATGTNDQNAAICVTTGLLTLLDREETQGVVAHEMSHIRNFDIRLMTTVAALVGAVALLADWSARGWRYGRFGGSARGSRSGRGKNEGGSVAAVLLLFVWLLAIVLAPLVARLLAMMVSRQREFLADASAAELTRNPGSLADALEAIESRVEPTAAIHQGSAQLCIADPLGRPVNEVHGRWADLFATHPPMHERIDALRAMAFERRPSRRRTGCGRGPCASAASDTSVRRAGGRAGS